MKKRQIPIFIALTMILLVGCTKRYVITDELSEQLPIASTVSVGEIVDELPIDMEEEKKPTIEHIEAFKAHLAEQIEKKEVFSASGIGTNLSEYELRGSIISYKKGSGFMRFLIGFGAGNSEVTIALQLVNRSTDEVVFGGNFKGSVGSYFDKGDKMFETVAKEFAKALKKAVKKQTKA